MSVQKLKKQTNIPSFYPFIQIKENARGKDKNIDLEVKKSYSVQVPYFCVFCTPPNKYNLFKEFCFPPLKYKYSILSTVLCGIIVCLFVSCDLGDAKDMGSCRLSQAVSGPGNPQKVLDFQINR